MDERSPGLVPDVLRDGSVALFRAEEQVFDAMVSGWVSQMLARGLQRSTIKGRCAVVRRFQEYCGTFPWQWGPVDVDEYFGHRRSGVRPLSLTTLRAENNALAMFCSYVSSPMYGWVALCEQRFDDVPVQVCFEWNSPRHTSEDAAPPARRALTLVELQRLFTCLDDEVDTAFSVGSKRSLPLLRDSVAFKVCYAYGLRRRELAMLELHDFGPNPHVPQYGSFGAVQVRWAKGTAGSGPRRRTVLTVPQFEWVVGLLQMWSSPTGRGRFATADRSSAMWPSERRGRMTLGSLGDAFTRARDAAGLPSEVGLHCLRHSYVTHLIEAGYDPLFVQTQVGHAYASTTSLYTSVSSDFKQRTVQKMIARRLARAEEIPDA